MTLRIFGDATAFLDVVEPKLLAREAENALLLGVATALRDGRRYGDEPPFLACTVDETAVAAAAVRTPPYNLLLGKATRSEWEPIAHHLAAVGADLPGVNAEEDVALDFAEWWSTSRGVRHEVAMRQRLYQLTAVTFPVDVPGQARWAEVNDAELLARWTKAFNAEAIPGSPPDDVTALIARHLAARTLLVWDDGCPVSMAAATRSTPHGGSVSLVYTPPEKRGHGYASACVAALSRRMLESGKQFCTLFTDLDNPTSNRIYQRMGYRPLTNFLEVRFIRITERD
ncbi:MAG: GNAT family N-acetyltransferase [Candidatus Bipolaricaulota bacterium]|nr:GNAT family N-acetyltransferase [Candidatus Bipolaricaulota bacterium]